MNLSDVDLLSLQTKFMQQDKTTQALCATLTPQFQKLADEANACLIYSRIDELTENILDELAWQMNVDFYSSQLDVSVKRNLIKNSLKLKKSKGTPQAIEDAIKIVFGRSEIKEWFEYDGEPFFFKISVEATNRGASEEDLKLLDQLIEAYKNKRSWVEIINIILNCNGSLNIASNIVSSDELTVYPWNITAINQNNNINFGAGTRLDETTIIYPKEE